MAFVGRQTIAGRLARQRRCPLWQTATRGLVLEDQAISVVAGKTAAQRKSDIAGLRAASPRPSARIVSHEVAVASGLEAAHLAPAAP